MKLFDPNIEEYLDNITPQKEEADFFFGVDWIFEYLNIQHSSVILDGKVYDYAVLIPWIKGIREASTRYFTVLEKFDPDTKRCILLFFGGGPNVWAAFRGLVKIELDMINHIRAANETITRGLLKDRVEFMLDNYFGGGFHE